MIPQTYAQWRHCIEIECGIPLKPDFIANRLQVLRDPANEETLRFAAMYGSEYARQVIGWFEQAQSLPA